VIRVIDLSKNSFPLPQKGGRSDGCAACVQKCFSYTTCTSSLTGWRSRSKSRPTGPFKMLLIANAISDDSKRRSSNTLSLLHDMRTLIWRDDIIFEEGGMLQVIASIVMRLNNDGLVVSPVRESGCFFSGLRHLASRAF
jgi:hypothetical protein